MKTLVTFAITWPTATLLLLWLGDYNMYVKFPNGSVILKEQANVFQRLIFSVLLAFLYSVINTGLLWGLQKLNEQRRKTGH